MEIEAGIIPIRNFSKQIFVKNLSPIFRKSFDFS